MAKPTKKKTTKKTGSSPKDSKYKDGRAQGVPGSFSGKRGIADRKDKAYGSETDQARSAAFRAAVLLKSNKKPASQVTTAKKGK